MSHDRGCSCGRENYEYEDCRKSSCPNQKMSTNRITNEALAKLESELNRKVDQRTDTDCVRACIATILHLPIREVPDFVAVYGGAWLGVLEDWLAERGLYISRRTSYHSHGGFWLLDGQSPRDKMSNHMVVMKGHEVYHDPHESRKGVMSDRFSYWIFPPDPASFKK